MKSKISVYDVVTNRIIKELETGVAPWRKTWKGAGGRMPSNLITQREYRGVNVFLLGNIYPDNRWLTFNQCSKAGGKVKSGEKASPVVFWQIGKKKNDKGKEEKTFILRYYNVFNVEQCELPPEYVELPEIKQVDPLQAGEAIVQGFIDKPVINEVRSGRAYYTPSSDAVTIPLKGQFENVNDYYATLFHELTHSTGHKSRLNREGIEESHFFGDEVYSREELIAEMGAAMLCNVSGIDGTLPNSASYIQSWLKVLKEDSKAVIHAASRAQRAVDHILGKTFKEESEE